MTGLIRGFVAVALIVAAAPGGAQAEGRMQATLDKPAVLTAGLTGHLMTDSPGPPHVYLSVVAFTPPRDRKPVEIVVRASAQPSGPPRELGRVAIARHAAFGVRDKARRQDFAFALPDDLKMSLKLTLTVALHPVHGGGAGARLTVGDASIR